MPATDLSGIVLAGGASRRMGHDKALLSLNAKALLSRAVTLLEDVCDDVLVVGRTELPHDLEHVRALADDDGDNGPLGGIATGLCHVKHPWAIVMAVDLPLLKAAVVWRLAELREDAQAVVPLVHGRPQPLCALYHRSVVSVIQARLALDDRRVIPFVESLRTRWVSGEELREQDPQLVGFTNINTRAEWEAFTDLR